MGDATGERRIRVAIVGAGIAGCCLAIGLLQNPRFDVHLFEAHPCVEVRGAGLALHGNALRAMDCISPEIKRAYFEKSHFMANEEDMEMATQIIIGSGGHAGTLVAELGRAKGRRTVHRAHFIQGLMENAIPEACVHFGERMTDISEDAETHGVTVTFANGRSEDFDVLFGCEGVKSPTRKFILGAGDPTVEPVNHDGWRCFHSHLPMEKAKGILPQKSIEKVCIFTTPLGYINGIPVDLGRTFSIGCYQRESKLSRAAGSDFRPDEWKHFCPELLERDPREGWKIQDHDHASAYYRGHVAMIGDAAHATGPHAGNGAAQAIEDAAILTHVFAHASSRSHVGAALQAFDEVRRPRSQKVIDITRRFGRLYSQDPEELDVERMKKEMKEGGMYTNGVDMDAQVQSAVDVFNRLLEAAR